MTVSALGRASRRRAGCSSRRRTHEFIRGVVGWASCAIPRAGRQLNEYQRQSKFSRCALVECTSGLPACRLPQVAAPGLGSRARRGLTLDVAVGRLHSASGARSWSAYPGYARRRRTSGCGAGKCRRSRMRGLPNLFVKISRADHEGARAAGKRPSSPPGGARPAGGIRPDRVMFGSDWPPTCRRHMEGSLAAFTQAIGAQTMETREHLPRRHGAALLRASSNGGVRILACHNVPLKSIRLRSRGR